MVWEPLDRFRGSTSLGVWDGRLTTPAPFACWVGILLGSSGGGGGGECFFQKGSCNESQSRSAEKPFAGPWMTESFGRPMFFLTDGKVPSAETTRLLVSVGNEGSHDSPFVAMQWATLSAGSFQKPPCFCFCVFSFFGSTPWLCGLKGKPLPGVSMTLNKWGHYPK